jgi:hypothetical protein
VKNTIPFIVTIHMVPKLQHFDHSPLHFNIGQENPHTFDSWSHMVPPYDSYSLYAHQVFLYVL